MSLQYAKESIVVNALKDIEENQKYMQDINLQSSIVWKGKSLEMTTRLSAALANNNRLTALNLVDCNINDVSVAPLLTALASNASLFHLNLSNNNLTGGEYVKENTLSGSAFKAGDRVTHEGQELTILKEKDSDGDVLLGSLDGVMALADALKVTGSLTKVRESPAQPEVQPIQ